MNTKQWLRTSPNPTAESRRDWTVFLRLKPKVVDGQTSMLDVQRELLDDQTHEADPHSEMANGAVGKDCFLLADFRCEIIESSKTLEVL